MPTAEMGRLDPIRHWFTISKLSVMLKLFHLPNDNMIVRPYITAQLMAIDKYIAQPIHVSMLYTPLLAQLRGLAYTDVIRVEGQVIELNSVYQIINVRLAQRIDPVMPRRVRIPGSYMALTGRFLYIHWNSLHFPKRPLIKYLAAYDKWLSRTRLTRQIARTLKQHRTPIGSSMNVSRLDQYRHPKDISIQHFKLSKEITDEKKGNQQ